MSKVAEQEFFEVLKNSVDLSKFKEFLDTVDAKQFKALLKSIDAKTLKSFLDAVDPAIFDALTAIIAPTLSEAFLDAALDNFEKYRGSTIVLKFGGEMVANETMLDDILRQAIKLKRHGCNVILVHGGGSQIDAALAVEGIAPGKDPITGKRMCDDKVLDVSYETLRKLNKDIVLKLNMMASEMKSDIVGMGEAGYNGGLIHGEPMHADTRTGNFVSVDEDAFKKFAELNKIPVIYPICMGPDGKPLNVNADDVAAGIALSCGAKSLIMVTDVPGVWDSNKDVIPELSIDKVKELIADGTISGGMIAKVEAAVAVAQKGIDVVITTPKDGGLFRELFTIKGSGTKIPAPEEDATPVEPARSQGYPIASMRFQLSAQNIRYPTI